MALGKGGLKPTINVIKKKRGHEEEPHSAGWKIAYADFMTAMMCFFLVMWLTSNMSQDEKKGIATYFDPIGASGGASGVGGVLGGQTIIMDGPLAEASAATRINPPLGSKTTTEETVGIYAVPREHANGMREPDSTKQRTKERTTAESREEMEAAEHEEEAFTAIEQRLKQAIQEDPTLQDMVNFVNVRVTEEGLKIDLIENDRRPMFALGSSALSSTTQGLLNIVADSLKGLPNRIQIVGHTDALPYSGTTFTNWELSADRASQTRHYLVGRTPTLNVSAVIGKADTELYVPEAPESPLNRRVSILVFRKFDPPNKPTDAPSRTLSRTP